MIYFCKCSKKLEVNPKSPWLICENCGRRYGRSSKGKLIQMSRPTKRAADSLKAGDSSQPDTVKVESVLPAKSG